MPGIRFSTLANDFVAYLERYGANVLMAGDLQSRPLQCRVTLGEFGANLEVYLWTVTTGGKGRGRPRERRIQLTGVDTFPLRIGTHTLLGGWCEEAGVYAFWDVRRHQHFTAGSPSLQIDLDTLESAYHHGFASESRHVREGTEIAIAVHPDYLFWYLNEWERLYECGDDIDSATDLIDAPTEEDRNFVDSGVTDSQRSRRHKIVSILQAFRDARFRPAVLRAYNLRCCVTGVSLRLVDAAHVVPVSEPTSTDDVWNGLALSASMHRAYDSGLLGVLPGGRLCTNPRVEQRLRSDGLDSGLQNFCSSLPIEITMPGSPDQRPREDNLLSGLTVRGWTEQEVENAMRA